MTLVTKDRDTLAQTIKRADDPNLIGYDRFADALLASGAVTTLPDALRQLAEDEDAMFVLQTSIYRNNVTSDHADAVRNLAHYIETKEK